MSDKPKAEFISNPRSLNSKVRVVPGKSADDLLKGAGLNIENLRGDFIAMLREENESLGKAMAIADRDAAGRAAAIEEMRRIVNDLRGTAGGYGYALVGEVTASACTFIDGTKEWNPATLAILRAHVDTLRAVVAGNIAGDGGPAGRQLMAGLQAVMARIKG